MWNHIVPARNAKFAEESFKEFRILKTILPDSFFTFSALFEGDNKFILSQEYVEVNTWILNIMPEFPLSLSGLFNFEES